MALRLIGGFWRGLRAERGARGAWRGRGARILGGRGAWRANSRPEFKIKLKNFTRF